MHVIIQLCFHFQIYVSADASGELIQRQLQHTNMVQQTPEPQQQQMIIQQPQGNRVILQSSQGQPVIVHQQNVQTPSPVVMNNRQQVPMQQQRVIYDASRQQPVYAITTPPTQQMQPRPMQQNIIVRQQPTQIRPQVRMQQPTLTYQRAHTPTTVIQNRATVAPTRVTQPQARLSTPRPARLRAPGVVAAPRSQVAAPRMARPPRYAPVTITQQPRAPRVLNQGVMRMAQPEQRQTTFATTAAPTRMLTPLTKVNRTYASVAKPQPAPVVNQPSATSKLEVRH